MAPQPEAYGQHKVDSTAYFFKGAGGLRDCSRGLRFDPQNTYGGSEPSEFHPVLGDPTSYFGIPRHQACKWCTDKHPSKTLTHIKKFLNIFR